MPALPPKVALDLKQALLDAYRRENDLRRFSTFYLDLNLEVIDGSNLEDKVFALIEWAGAHGRLDELFDGVTKDRRGNVLLAAAVQNARASLAGLQSVTWYREPDDPLKTLVLKGGRAFIDRKPFRASVQNLIAGDASTLVVTGERLSGKTYSQRFVMHLADVFRFRVARVRLQEMGSSFGPDALTANLLREMGRSASLKAMPDRQSQAARWTEELRIFLTGEIAESGDTWWIVIDGVDSAYVQDDTLDLIKKLVIAADDFSYPLRVILLDCVEPLPPDVDPYAEKECIEAIEVGMLSDFFSELAEHRQVESDAEAIKRAVNEVERLAPPGPDYLRRLAKAVEKVAKGLPG